MRWKFGWIVVMCVAAFGTAGRGDTQVITEISDSGFQFKTVPAPAINDAATDAKFKLLDGRADRNGADLSALHDGKVPESDDQPDANFFFDAGTEGGLLEIDLGAIKSIKRVSTYSWHTGSRAPQFYRFYAADGKTAGFTRNLKKDDDPTKRGWTLVASVDSRSRNPRGGQHGVNISSGGEDALGRYQYLLLEVAPTETEDGFGNTFFSEIDIVDADGPALQTIPTKSAKSIEFASADGTFQYSIDVTDANDLEEWSNKELRPVIEKWYPKIVEMFPSEGYSAPKRVVFRYRDGKRMQGTPAYASGATITMNADWFRRELKREARGSVVHEMVHVVQSYSGGRRGGQRNRVPGWIVEGIPDYVRWFLYEPESKGAEITERNLAAARYDASYRISGNFLNWLSEHYDKEIVKKLNVAARQGKYSADFWKETTGKTEQELDDEWKAFHRERLDKSK